MNTSISTCSSRPIRGLAMLIFLIIGSLWQLSGQRNDTLDSLNVLLSGEKTDTGRIILMYKISHELQNSDIDRSLAVAETALAEARKIKFRKGEGSSLIQIGNIEQIKGNMDKAEQYNLEALEILGKADDKNGVAVCYNNLGIIAQNRGEPGKAYEWYRKSLGMNRMLGRKAGEATSLFCIGSLKEAGSEYDSALIFYEKAIAISETIGDKKLIPYGKISLGNIHYKMGNFSGFVKYTSEALAIYENTRNYLGVLKTCMSLGEAAWYADSIDMALMFYHQALFEAKQLKSRNDIANISKNLGDVFDYQGVTDSALFYYRKAAAIYRETGSKENLAITLTVIAGIYRGNNDLNVALEYLDEARGYATESQSPTALSEVFRQLSLTYSLKGDFVNAYRCVNRYTSLRDSIMSVEKQKQILELQTKYETERKEKENQLLLKDSKLLKNSRNSLVIGGLLLVIIVLVIFRSLTVKKRDNAILKAQKEEISRQKEIVEIQKTSITDSIQYARRIQTAMLPPMDYIESGLLDAFILYMPRDIVSGDFYWMRMLDENHLLVCAADCTGHGVPGAFMSMLGMSLLNDIASVNSNDIIKGDFTTGNILDEMRKRVKASMRQTGKEGEARDGMDMALCLLDKRGGKIKYSGAINSLYHVTDGVLTEMKATRNPIGIYVNEMPFETHEATIPKGSVIYMFSDGYSDQIGKNGKKFLSKNFKQMLSGISHLPSGEIREKLREAHLEWKGEEEQVDDILVIGIRI
ncbi:MAG: tetratricopeptide repeat protein [Bacteroidales bacterium]